jgi:hypothetical protein
MRNPSRRFHKRQRVLTRAYICTAQIYRYARQIDNGESRVSSVNMEFSPRRRAVAGGNESAFMGERLPAHPCPRGSPFPSKLPPRTKARGGRHVFSTGVICSSSTDRESEAMKLAVMTIALRPTLCFGQIQADFKPASSDVLDAHCSVRVPHCRLADQKEPQLLRSIF